MNPARSFGPAAVSGYLKDHAGTHAVSITFITPARGPYSRDGTGSRVSGSPGQQFGSGSGRITGQSPDPAF